MVSSNVRPESCKIRQSSGAAPLVFFKGADFHMRNPLERRYGEEDLHFITFRCLHRRRIVHRCTEDMKIHGLRKQSEERDRRHFSRDQ